MAWWNPDRICSMKKAQSRWTPNRQYSAGDRQGHRVMDSGPDLLSMCEIENGMWSMHW
jgi:lipoprotein-anchoring transpeptidase ErfK/SrfK